MHGGNNGLTIYAWVFIPLSLIQAIALTFAGRLPLWVVVIPEAS